MTSTARYGNPARISGYARSAITPSIAASAVCSHRGAVPVYHGDSRAHPCGATRGLDPLHAPDNFGDQRFVGIVMAGTQPSMRPDAGLAAERVDLEAAVVGQRRNPGAIEIEARLDQRVLGEGRASFFRSFGDSKIAERDQFKLKADVAQDQSILGQLRPIGG